MQTVRGLVALNAGLPLRLCRLMTLFAVQGAIVLLMYWRGGFDLALDEFPPGLRLDPIHASIHLVAGVAAVAIGAGAPRAARTFTQLFAVFYLGLAVLGTVTDYHLGMNLQLDENVFHWTVGGMVAVAAFHPRTRGCEDVHPS